MLCDPVDPPRRPEVREPGVLAVVLNWNRHLDTVACVESLLCATYPNLDIAVCDNASDDFSALRDGLRLLDFDPVAGDGSVAVSVLDRAEAERGAPEATGDIYLIKTGGNLGYAGGNNVGIRFAMARGYDFVWLLNNDTLVAPDALDRMMDAMAEWRDAGIVGSTHFQYSSPRMKLSLGGGHFNKWFGIDTPRQSIPSDVVTNAEVDHVLGASMLVRAAAIREVGLIDESYFLFREETDWCFRMRAAGWRLSTSLLSVIWHRLGGTIRHRSPVHDYYSTRNMLLLTKRFSPQTLPTVVAYTFVRAMVPKIVRGQFARIPFVWRGFRDFFAGVTGYVELTPDAPSGASKPATARNTASSAAEGA